MNTATEWNVLRPNLEYTESGKIKPCIHMDQLNPIEQTLLDLLKFYISNSADIREQYTIGEHGLPLSSELSFWGEEEEDDFEERHGKIYICFNSIVNWFKCIHSYNECNEEPIIINEMKTYLKGRANDIRERDIIHPRYIIIYELTESQIMLYIRNYYYMRFRGPLLDSLITQEFSPK